jgi:pimeloyl-ACP methyl ester carboxylesterase
VSVRGALRLVRWLGPWEKDGVPRDVTRRELSIEGPRTMRAYEYRPRGRARGVYVIAPGLHFLGPDDPRLDRFCRILAASGVVVLAPFLPDHCGLRVTARTTDDLAAAFEVGESLGLGKPAIFSISFGSQPAIALAARESHRDRVAALVLFGGFADYNASVRFCLTGRASYDGRELAMTHDPLNAPVVWMHLLDELGLPCDRAKVLAAWQEMVERTWGKMELKAAGARDPIAHEIAERLDEREREVFLLGCGLRDGAGAHLETALPRIAETYAFTDPRAALARVRCPIAIVHGRDDDVIPWFEAEKLRAAAPHARLMITGLYGHTGAATVSPRALARELATMFSVVRTLANAPAGGL